MSPRRTGGFFLQLGGSCFAARDFFQAVFASAFVRADFFGPDVIALAAYTLSV